MKRKILLVVLGIAVLPAVMWAQTPPSATSTVTSGLFEEAEDYYLDPADYSMVERTVMFLMFDMPTNSTVSGAFQGGAGTWIGDLYFGGLLHLNHAGKDGQISGASESIDVDTDVLLDANNQIVGRVETRTETEYYRNMISDQIRMLVGLGSNLGIYGSIYYSDYGFFGSYYPNYTFPGTATWNNASIVTPGVAAQTVTVTNNAGTVTSRSSQTYGDGYDKTLGLYTDVGVGINLPLGESNLALKGIVGFDVVDNSQFGAYQTYTAEPGSATGTSYTPTLGEGGNKPEAVSGVTDYEYEAVKTVDSYLNINPQIDARFLFPSSETLSLEGGWLLDTNFRLYTGSYVNPSGESATAAGKTTTYSQTIIARNVSSIGTEVTTTQTDYLLAEDHNYFYLNIALPMAARFNLSEGFRFGVEYQPSFDTTIESTQYTGQSIQRVTIEDGDGVDSAGDSTTVQTVTQAGYTTTRQSFGASHSLSTGAQFYLIPGKLRVNLGAQVTQSLATRTDSKTKTTGLTTFLEEQAIGTAAATADDLVETNYVVNTDVRAADDFVSILLLDGSSATVDYDAGITFFFDENMYLDLNLDSAGNIWDVNRWSLDMTILQ